MNESTSVQNRRYSLDDINRLAKILGIENDAGKTKKMSQRLEEAAFIFSFASRDEVPKLPPSDKLKIVSRPISAIEKLLFHIRALPQQINNDLTTAANEFGDKTGCDTGANRFFEVVHDLDWIVACLHSLENKYHDQKSKKGGNRRNDDRGHFFVALHRIVLAYKGAPFPLTTNRDTGKKTGHLVEFLEICLKPFPSNTELSSIVVAYTRAVKHNAQELDAISTCDIGS